MNRTLNSLQKIKFNRLANRINFEKGKKKYLLNKHSVNRVKHSSNNKPPDDKKVKVLLLIGIFIGSYCYTKVLMYK